jgi:exopolysaccharide biosynthesis polyprenyl glycosylphosphotransferase
MSLYSRYDRFRAGIAGAGDAAVALSAYLLAFWLRTHTTFGVFDGLLPPGRFGEVPHYLLFLAASQVALLYFFRFYEGEGLYRPLKSAPRLATVVLLQVLILIAYYFFRQPASLAFPRTIFLIYAVLDLLLLLTWRGVLKLAVLGELPRPRVLIVGANCAAQDLVNEIRRLPQASLDIVGIVLGPGDDRCERVDGLPVLGSYEEAARIARETNVDEVIIASTTCWQESVVEDFVRHPDVSCRVSLLPTAYEMLVGRISRLRIHDIPLIELRREPDGPWERFIKRTMDLVVASLALVALGPVALVVACAVRATSRGPIVFRQVRVGQHGRHFKILKFRTMVEDAEKTTGPVLAGPGDPRITPIGRFLRKTRLDEIPQLINVVRGEMSLVGPRPERPHFVEQFCERYPFYRERLVVKPGLTGLAQVNGGYDTSPENKLKYDLAYIYNKSIWLDLRILAETIKVVLAGGGEPTRESQFSFIPRALRDVPESHIPS